MCKNLKLNW